MPLRIVTLEPEVQGEHYAYSLGFLNKKAYTPSNNHRCSIIKIIGSGDKPIGEHLRDSYHNTKFMKGNKCIYAIFTIEITNRCILTHYLIAVVNFLTFHLDHYLFDRD